MNEMAIVATAAEAVDKEVTQHLLLAEDQRKDAETARAAADNAYRQSMQLSPDQFLRLESIKMQREVCGRQGACTFLLGGGAMPVLNVR